MISCKGHAKSCPKSEDASCVFCEEFQPSDERKMVGKIINIINFKIESHKYFKVINVIIETDKNVNVKS